MFSKRAKNLNLLILFFVFVLITFLGCKKKENPVDNPVDDPPGTIEILIQDDSFSPASKTITAGTTIKWINKGTHIHTVNSGTQSAPTNMFISPHLVQNGEFSFTFSQTGTYSFYCIHHSSMTGTIIVQ